MSIVREAIQETLQSNWETTYERDDGETWETGKQRGILRVEYPNDGNNFKYTPWVEGSRHPYCDTPEQAMIACEDIFERAYAHIIEDLIMEKAKTYFKVEDDEVQEVLDKGGTVSFIERDATTGIWHIILEHHKNEF